MCWSVAAAALPGFGPAKPGPLREHVDALFGVDARSIGPSGGTQAQAEFGKSLFAHETASGSCAQCHDPRQLGQDRLTHGRNTPALADVSRQLLFGWDGLQPDLRAMVQYELTDRLLLNTNESARQTLVGDAVLHEQFEAAFPGDEPSLERFAQAIAAHLSRSRTRGRWDRFVEGDDAGLSNLERKGLATFIEVGCATCHRGRNLGGASAHVMGQAVPFATEDLGRAAVTGVAADRFVFKAPMLRHAARTGPYLHDGSVHELGEVVRLMGMHELGKRLTQQQVDAVVVFLQATAESE
ncbi:MAG: cytochrome c peroxidase [Planctomycetota bacterium]